MDDFQNSRFRDDEKASNRRGTDPMIEVIMHKVVKVEASMEKVADALTKLAVIEERQTADRAALERAFAGIAKAEERCAEAFERTVAKLEKLEGRIDTLEQAAPMTAQTTQWVNQAMWAAAAVAATVVLSKVGIL